MSDTVRSGIQLDADRPLKNLVILISGHGSNMEAILQSVKEREILAQVSMVISDRPDAFGLQRAREYGVSTQVVAREVSDSPEDFNMKLTELLLNLTPDLIALAGFMTILTDDLVNHFQGKIMNIHPALLPKYKGLHTHRRVLSAGDNKHGCSTHFVTPELDSGPVIMQAQLEVLKNDTEQSLAQRVLAYEHIIYCRSLALYCNDRLRMQDNLCILDGEPLEHPLFFA